MLNQIEEIKDYYKWAAKLDLSKLRKTEINSINDFDLFMWNARPVIDDILLNAYIKRYVEINIYNINTFIESGLITEREAVND